MSIIRNCNVDILKRSSRSKGRKKRRARDPFLQPLLRRRSNDTAFSRCDEARLGLAISFVTLLRISRARPFLSFLSTTWRRSHFGKYNAVQYSTWFCHTHSRHYITGTFTYRKHSSGETHGHKHVEGPTVRLPKRGMRVRDGGDQSPSGGPRFESTMRMWECNEETIC